MAEDLRAPQKFLVRVPVPGRPLLSQSLEVVPAEEFFRLRAELLSMEKQASSWLQSAKKKVTRFRKNRRFIGAYNYWYGNATSCEGLLYSIRRALGRKGYQ